MTLFTDFDVLLFKSGKHYRLYEKLGSHIVENEGVKGVYFAVWAPNASKISVIGSFNGWNSQSHPLNQRWDGTGIWEGFIANIGKGELYKYHITNQHSGEVLQKSDPFALHWETPPNTSSVVWEMDYEWKDSEWLQKRQEKTEQQLAQPYSVYEMHMGSWRRYPDNNISFSYRDLGDQLPAYLKEMGFTHVEFMPVMEHPYGPSWGYQIVGYFAPTSRFGTPEDFMYLIDQLHQNGIGVILDWVPSHFPEDPHGLARFDGTHLYEHADPRKGFHPDWKSAIFNYGRNEVRSFLISNALFWLDKYHADGLRVDAVASMLYLDYSRKEGEWIPNEFGGRENLEAISLIKEFNEAVYANYPDVQTIAEESTAWPGVSRPLYDGGLGFGMKWMMGWMHDTLKYFKEDPLHRRFHQGKLSFSMVYAFHENFMLPLSHDEVVYGKGSLIGRMPGDEWQQFANLRLMFSYMFTHPGTKLLFMGGEFGQHTEWDFDGSLDWDLLQKDGHKGIKATVRDLNHLYTSEKALHELQFSEGGFQWIDHSDSNNSVFSYIRKGKDAKDKVVVIGNFTPNVLHDYKFGVPDAGTYEELFNSDAKKYHGSGMSACAEEGAFTQSEVLHGFDQTISITLPPLGMVVLKLK